jgi:Zn-dependent protease
MGWSWRIGRIAGINVYMHPTFLLLLVWVAVAHYFAHGDLGEALYGLVFILALFGIVVLHELGRALAARRYGIRTRDITLLPIGGVARLERIPEEPWQELMVAVAGPAVNVVMAAGIYLGLVFAQGLSLSPVGAALRVGGGFVQQLFWVNVTLLVFNLVPAFPMDGGRVLRALLAMRLDYVRATQLAAAIGQWIALFFGVVGVLYNPFLIFIALFVWRAGTQEAGLVTMRSALGDVPVMRAMITDFRALRSDDRLAQGVEHLLGGFQQDFPVVEDGRVVGVLTRNDLAAALGRYGPDTRVEEVMQRDFVTASPREMLQTAFARLQEGHCRTVPVVKDGRVLGLLTADHLAEVLMIQQALQEAHRPALFGGLRPTAESWLRAGGATSHRRPSSPSH